MDSFGAGLLLGMLTADEGTRVVKVPTCPTCGQEIKPEVEPIDPETWDEVLCGPLKLSDRAMRKASS